MLSLIPLVGRTIRTYVSGVRHHLKIRLLPDFQSSLIISLVLRGATSPEAATDVRIPISLCMLHAMFNSLPVITQPYQSCIFRAILILGFFGLFRPGKLTLSLHVILISNIKCNANSIFIKMESSKCNKMSTPQLLHIYQQPYVVCPVQAVHNYLAFR